jgi:hypothetical protein
LKKLTKHDYEKAMQYILKEPEFNLFIIGDLEIYGMEDPNVSAYTSDSWNGGEFPYFILNYRNSFIFYSHNPDFPAEEAADFLSSQKLSNLSGKMSLIERLIPHLKNLEAVPTYLSRLNSVSMPPTPAGTVKRLTAEDVPAICNLLLQIEDFYTLRSKTEKENHEDILESITHGGRMYGIFEDDTLVSVAGTTAENSMSAMVVSVATLPAWRKKGYASYLVAELCSHCLKEGMKFLCLFYDNPEAGKIYRKLGFEELGQYAMVRSVE